MTDKQEKAPWEIEAEEALKSGNASYFTPDVIKLIIANQAMNAGTPGAQVAASKTLAQTQAMLIQVQRDDDAKLTDEQVAKSAAEATTEITGIPVDELTQVYLTRMQGKPATIETTLEPQVDA